MKLIQMTMTISVVCFKNTSEPLGVRFKMSDVEDSRCPSKKKADRQKCMPTTPHHPQRHR